MSQTPQGAALIAAKKAGLTLTEYLARRAAGLKRCTKCKTWREVALFNLDATRFDGRNAKCQTCVRVVVRKCWKGRPSTFKGRHHTAEAKAKIGAVHRGKQRRLGIPHTPETKAKISARLRVSAARGPRAPGYIDGKGVERLGLRASPEAKRWRYDVMLRDGFMCVHCGDDRGGNLHAHHIRPFATHPDMRFDTANGVTLCEACHAIVHIYGLELWAPIQ